MIRLAQALVTIWRLASPYFCSDDRWPGRFLLAAVIAIELAITAVNVMLNQWNNAFYNALQDRDWNSFVTQLLIFAGLATVFIILAVYQIYLRQWLQIRWRTWMTRQYLDHWMTDANHYRMQLLGDAADNPDQRIAEDIRLFVESGLIIALRLLGAVVSFFSFVVILWTLSEQAPFHLFGHEVSIPGYLVWAGLLYAVVGTALTHLVGSPLIGLNFNQQRYEADFRFNLVRVRENSEQIALLRGEAAEDRRLLDRFAAVVGNWWAIMRRTKRLTFLTAGYAQFANVFPFIVVSPAYFASRIQLGGLMQTASAFGSVQDALSVIITSYRDIAEWSAVLERLDGFDTAIVTARAVATAPEAIALTPRRDAGGIGIRALEVGLPDGRPLVAADRLEVAPADRVLVNGPSGSGKSTLFRALAGIWPFGSGTVAIPPGAHVMMLPQRPYLPIGSLIAAVSYPALPDRFTPGQVREILQAVGLSGLSTRLEDEEHWNRMLSLGEQQRLAIARAILHAPDYLFLDEATASLDEPAEAALYTLLQHRLPGTALVSIGHRSTLAAYHRRTLVLRREGNRHRLGEQAVAAAE